MNLDPEVCGQLHYALENVSNNDQTVQRQIFEIVENLSQRRDYGIYLLAAVTNEGLSVNGRVTAALQMKRQISLASPEVCAFVKRNAESMLLPLLCGPCSSLAVGVAALLAEIVAKLGHNVVSDMSRSIAHMLNDEKSVQAGLDLCNELLLNECTVDPGIIPLLPKFLDTPLLINVLKVCEHLALQSPLEVKGLIIGPLLERHESLSSDVLYQMLVVIASILVNDMDEILVRFVVACISHVNPDIGSLASHIFGENERIPFCAEAVVALYNAVAHDDELAPDGSISFEALKTLETICERHPKETAEVVQSLFPKTEQECSEQSVRSAIRTISGLFQYMPNPQVLREYVKTFLGLPMKHEVAACMTSISKRMIETGEVDNEWISETAKLLAGLINDENALVRTHALRSLLEFFEAVPMPAEPFYSLICGCFEKNPEDEWFLVLDVAAAFCESVTSLESVNVAPFLQFLCEKFMSAQDSDPMLVYPLRVVSAMLPKIPKLADGVIEAIGGKLLLGFGTTDTELINSALEILSSFMEINPQHPIFESAVPLLPQHLRLCDSTTEVLTWGLVSSIIRKRSDLFGHICEPVVQAALLICENDEFGESYQLCNVALVMFDVIPILGVENFSRTNAKIIFNGMLQGLERSSESEILDIQNIGCCMIRIMSMYDKIRCDPEVIQNLIPYLHQMEDPALVANIEQMLQKCV